MSSPTNKHHASAAWVPQYIDQRDLFDYPWLADPHRRPVQPQQFSFHDIYTSKIGGVPAWLAAEHLDESVEEGTERHRSLSAMIAPHPVATNGKEGHNSLLCKLCGRSMVLVTQCYVPIGALERVIYVFGCNSSSCSKKSDGFVAFRLQFKRQQQQQQEEEKSGKAEEQIQQVLEQKTRVDNIVTAASIDISSGEQTGSDGDSVDDDELEDLLNLRDVRISQERKEEKKPAGESKIAPDMQKSDQAGGKLKEQLQGYLPCHLLETYEEPEYNLREDELEDLHGDNDKENDSNDTSQDALLSSSRTASHSSARARADLSHEYKLLREYKERVGELSSVGPSGDGDSYGEDDDDDDDDAQESSSISQVANPALAELIKDEVFIDFQAVLSYAPEQSIRWHFGGDPLWITGKPDTLPRRYVECMKLLEKQMEHMNPIDRDEFERKIVSKCIAESIPKCPRCGSARVFELQVMPTVIYQLKVWKHAARKGDEGMDFGTVTIYTCSRQCMPEEDATHAFQYAEEFVHVQPPI